MKAARSLGYIAVCLALCTCASKEKVVCPTIEIEAISVCRAKQHCAHTDSRTRVGVGFGLGSRIGVGSSVGMGNDNYPDCIDRDLAEQKAASDSWQKSTTEELRRGK